MTFKQLLDKTGYNIKSLSAKYGIPLRTCYNWQQGIRQPPEYVLLLILDIYLLERGLSYAKEEYRLGEGISEGCEGIQEAR